jgi:PPOX class probable F420-dependent enzyme
MEQAKQFTSAAYIALETFRKNGDPVRTTVWVVEDAGVIYVRTGAHSGKVKRIRRNPRVRLARTSLRGAIVGDWADGVASIVGDEDRGRIIELFREKYGLQIRLLGLLARLTRSRQLDPVVLAIDLTAA